jgi:putative transposase
LTVSKRELAQLYKRESNLKMERLLLTLRVEVDGEEVPAHVAQELHRSKPWASYWLDRYNKGGIEGLKDKPRCGRTPHLPSEIAIKISKKLTESKQGWSTKQVNDMIVQESGIQYHYTHIYRLLHKWGFKHKVPRKVHVNSASEQEKGQFKKEHRRY